MDRLHCLHYVRNDGQWPCLPLCPTHGCTAASQAVVKDWSFKEVVSSGRDVWLREDQVVICTHGQIGLFHVDMQDSCMSPYLMGGEMLSIRLSSSQDSIIVPQAAITDLHNGVYRVRLVIPNAGSYLVHLNHTMAVTGESEVTIGSIVVR